MEKKGSMNRKRMVLLAVVVVLASTVAILIFKNLTQTKVRSLFRMNKELQEQGYYMADFEFKMMGIVYWMDQGNYLKAFRQLDAFHEQLSTREGLLKVPTFADKQEELAFYLNLQNPNTGAFIDDACPYCTYNEVTENILAHLDALAQETGQPLRLKYPLRYLDEIRTPETLRAFLDDVSSVGWVASRLPQTTFVFARSMLSYFNGEGVIERNRLYEFSPEWKRALLQWFYDNQDPLTGFWGPESRTSGKLLKGDLTNTASIIKAFAEKGGASIHEGFPLRYRDAMFKTALKVMAEPMPDDDDLAEWHEWALKMGKGMGMITRYLWNDASQEDKAKARALMERHVRTCFSRYYVPAEGAFSHYPDAQHATLDGTGGKIGELSNLGFFAPEAQKCLWGDPEAGVADFGEWVVSRLTTEDLAPMGDIPEINSVRFFASSPAGGAYASDVLGVFYPRDTRVLDVVELTSKVRAWLDATTQSMGNWVSRETTAHEVKALNVGGAPVYRGAIPAEASDEALEKRGHLIAIGFDVLQVPRARMAFTRKEADTLGRSQRRDGTFDSRRGNGLD